MNYIKKVERQRKRINALEEEVKRLQAIIKETTKETERIKQRCEFQIKLAEEKEKKFQELIIELEKEKQLYHILLEKLKIVLKKNNGVYKKAVKDINNNLK